MTCADFQNRLSAYMDGELSRWRRWKVENHLRCCAGCRRSLEELGAVDDGLLLLAEEHEAPEFITGAVMHRIPAMPPARRHMVVSWGTGLALAGVQIAALFGTYWWGFARGAVGTPPTNVTTMSPFGVAAPQVGREPLPVSRSAAGSAAPRRFPSVWGHNPTGLPLTLPPDEPRTTPASRRKLPAGHGPALQWEGAR